MFLVAAVAVLALSLVVLAQDIPTILPQLQTIRSGQRPYLVRIGEAQALAYGGLLPAAAAGAGVLRACSARPVARAVLLAGLGAVLLLSVLSYSVQSWTHAKYPAGSRAGLRALARGDTRERRGPVAGSAAGRLV